MIKVQNMQKIIVHQLSIKTNFFFVFPTYSTLSLDTPHVLFKTIVIILLIYFSIIHLLKHVQYSYFNRAIKKNRLQNYTEGREEEDKHQVHCTPLMPTTGLPQSPPRSSSSSNLIQVRMSMVLTIR